MADIFISYKREDRRFAERLSIALEQLGFDVWWDFDLLSGDRFRNVIRAVIDQCAAAIVLWSERAITSDFVMDEATYAKSKGKLCPAQIGAVDLPFGFGQIHTDDLADWDGELSHPGFQALVRAVEQRVGRKGKLGAARKGAEAQSAGAELEAFKAAQLANNPSALRAFTKAYPRGMFAGFVRGQLETMEAHVGAGASHAAALGGFNRDADFQRPEDRPPAPSRGSSQSGSAHHGAVAEAPKKASPLPLLAGGVALLAAAVFFLWPKTPEIAEEAAPPAVEAAVITPPAEMAPPAPDNNAEIKALQEQLTVERAARELLARDQLARDQAAKDQATRDQAARDQASRDQAARDQAARDQAARDAAQRAAKPAAYDLTQLNANVRNAVENARAAEARANAAAASARAAAERARASGVRTPQNGEGIDSWTSGDFAGDSYAGQYSGGKRGGYGVFSHAQNANNKTNALRYEGEYADDKLSGYGAYSFRDGNRHAGGYRESKRSGSGVFRFASGGRYEGEYVNDKRNGYGVYWTADGRVSEAGIWTDAKLTTPLGPQGQ